MKRCVNCMVVVMLLVLVASMLVGCIKVVRKSEPAATPAPAGQPVAPPSGAPEMPGQRPVINSFSASPETIYKGQSVTLSWDVSGATAVTIQPYIGAAQQVGSQVLPLANSTTFTLTATNSAGSTKRDVTVIVGAPLAGTPDLEVTEIFVRGDVVYYKVANRGGVESKGGTSKLYVGNMEKSTDYLEPVPAGQELTGGFFKYSFEAMGDVLEVGLHRTQVKVCVDVEDATKESNEFNNCLTAWVGATYEFDFVKYAHVATWRSGAGVLKWPMVGGDSKGAAFLSKYVLEDGRTHSNTLAMYPQRVVFGSIQGTFGAPYTKQWGLEGGTKEVELPPDCRFSAKVGFKEGATKTDGVTVSFGIVDPSGSIVVLKSMKVGYDGMLDVVEADLGALAGQKVFFVLRVEAGTNWEDDYLIWVDPRVYQE